MRLRVLHLCLAALPALCPAAQDMAHFEKHIRPLFLEHCQSCHGAEKQKGGLRLDSAAGWQTGGDSGPALVVGNTAASLMMKALSHTDRDLKMPPKGKLPDSVILAVQEWITMGAPDPRTGSAPTLHKGGTAGSSQHWAFQLPKKQPGPVVKDASWPRTELDHFILAKLEAKGMKPALDADETTLQRRLSYDLTGLPPEAQKRNVEELLKSRAYAERWAQHWLDAARFAESSGGGRTLPFKDAWRYRDYVIQSMEEGLPLDRFITEQIAGDLLPYENAAQRRRQLIATGFLVLGAHNYEEQDKAALRMDMVDEQLETMGRSLLGMTLGCARCHDHKFDPIPTADYYALAGILRSTKLIRNTKENVAHWIEAPLPLDGEAETQMAAHEAAVAALENEVDAAKKALKKLTPKLEPTDGGKRPLELDELPGIVVDDSQATKVGPWANSTRYPTYIGTGYLHDENQNKGTLTLTFVPSIPKAGRYEVRFSYTSTTGRASSVPLTVQHADGETEVKVDQSVLPPLDGRFISLGLFRFEAGTQGFVLLSNEGTQGHVTADAVVFIPEEDLATLAATEDKPGEEKDSPLARAHAELKALETKLKKLQRSHDPRPEAMVVSEHDEVADCPIHIRGNLRNLGKTVPRGVLQVAYHEQEPLRIPEKESGRKELAHWLTSERNPLTARVLVNRVWMHLFGEGIVRSVDNFGTTGDTPTHPELLDHLAHYLMQHDWELRALLRYIVSSRAYAMSSKALAENASADPDNALLHSQRRKRLDAHAIRDTILSSAGTLDLSYLGPNIQNSIKVKDSNDNTLQGLEYSYVFADTRRSIYTPAFRNKRLDLFEVFDFSDINQTLGKRNVSTVSTQALYLMNHPFVMDQAKAAATLLLSKRCTDAQRLRMAYQRSLGREPTEREQRLARDFLQTSPGDDADRQAESWALFMHTLFASMDFRYLE